VSPCCWAGCLIWLAVRALLLQERMEAQHENIEAAQESRAFVRALMDNLPVAVWLKTTDHRYQAANLMWAQYNPTVPSWQHHSVDRLVGHTDRELYEPQRAAEFEQTDDIVIATGAAGSRTMTRRTPMAGTSSSMSSRCRCSISVARSPASRASAST